LAVAGSGKAACLTADRFSPTSRDDITTILSLLAPFSRTLTWSHPRPLIALGRDICQQGASTMLLLSQANSLATIAEPCALEGIARLQQRPAPPEVDLEAEGQWFSLMLSVAGGNIAMEGPSRTKQLHNKSVIVGHINTKFVLERIVPLPLLSFSKGRPTRLN